MTLLALRDIILSGSLAAECAPHVHTPDMPKIGADETRAKDQAIADILNEAGAVKELRPRLIGYREVLLELGPDVGAAILDRLTNAANNISKLRWSMRLLEMRDFDIGSQTAQAQIAELGTAGVITSAEVEALQALGMSKVNISGAQVSVALRGPWGNE